MTFPVDLARIRTWKETTLDSKSKSFCGAKWYHSSIWLWRGWTASCHHNPPHQIDKEQIIQKIYKLPGNWKFFFWSKVNYSINILLYT